VFSCLAFLKNPPLGQKLQLIWITFSLKWVKQQKGRGKYCMGKKGGEGNYYIYIKDKGFFEGKT
jgi:hypothetical protein